MARAASGGLPYQPAPTAASMAAPRLEASTVSEATSSRPVASAKIRRQSALLAGQAPLQGDAADGGGERPAQLRGVVAAGDDIFDDLKIIAHAVRHSRNLANRAKVSVIAG